MFRWWHNFLYWHIWVAVTCAISVKSQNKTALAFVNLELSELSDLSVCLWAALCVFFVSRSCSKPVAAPELANDIPHAAFSVQYLQYLRHGFSILHSSLHWSIRFSWTDAALCSADLALHAKCGFFNLSFRRKLRRNSEKLVLRVDTGLQLSKNSNR